MPKFRMMQRNTEVVIRQFWEEFDTSDQEAWENLRGRIDNFHIDVNDFPELAPDDPETWFSLYKALNFIEYEHQDEDDWFSDRKGTTEYEFILSNEDGDEVMSE